MDTVSWTDASGNVFVGSFASPIESAGSSSAGVEVAADHTKEIIEAIGKAKAAALEEIGQVAEGYAKRECPVDTGRLRNSIAHVTDAGDEAAVIGTNVEYAIFVEKGTSRMKPEPFLTPAAEGHGSVYRSILRKHLGG